MCGACDTPELWRAAAALYARVNPRCEVNPGTLTLYQHTRVNPRACWYSGTAEYLHIYACRIQARARCSCAHTPQPRRRPHTDARKHAHTHKRCGNVFPVSAVVGAAVLAAVCAGRGCARAVLVRGGVSRGYTVIKHARTQARTHTHPTTSDVRWANLPRLAAITRYTYKSPRHLQITASSRPPATTPFRVNPKSAPHRQRRCFVHGHSRRDS